MRKFYRQLKAATLISALTLSLTACGDDNVSAANSAAQPADSKVVELVTDKVTKTLSIEPKQVLPAAIPGYQLAVTAQGNFLVSNDGRYMIYGRVFDLDNGMMEITDQPLNASRAKQLAGLKDHAINYLAKGEEKFNVYVFTDITCGYCRKMHRQIADYQNAGISMHYLAFPRSPDSAVALQKIWCDDKPAKAMTDAMLHDKITDASCDDTETVTVQHQAGIEFGVRGTPALVLEDGTMLPGYRSAADLLKILEQPKAQ